jgi:hypothetical protein
MQEKTFKAVIPQSWSEVTLEKYLKYRKTIDMYKDDDEDEGPDKSLLIALDILCEIPPTYLPSLSLDKIKLINDDLNSFMSKSDFELQRFITIDGIEYGFEPNLSEMSYGAYLDISKNDTIGMDKNWPKIMAILYRKVAKKELNKAGDTKYYEIENYTGKEDDAPFLKTGMDVNFGCMFFFINLSRDLLQSTMKSLMESEEIQPALSSIMGKNGEAIRQLLNSPMGTSLNSMK